MQARARLLLIPMNLVERIQGLESRNKTPDYYFFFLRNISTKRNVVAGCKFLWKSQHTVLSLTFKISHTPSTNQSRLAAFDFFSYRSHRPFIYIKLERLLCGALYVNSHFFQSMFPINDGVQEYLGRFF